MNSTRSNFRHNRITTGTVMSDLVNGLQSLVRGEIRLAKAEFQFTAKEASRSMMMAVVFGVMAILGLLPFLAFLVIGVGQLIGNNYWLSSLIISGLLMGIGFPLGVLFLKKLTRQNFTFPATRQSVQNEADLVQGKLHEVSEQFSRRAS